MANTELADLSYELEKINAKMQQALIIRTNIITMRLDALSDSNNIDFVKLLKANNNEVKFMKIMDEAIPRTNKILSNMKSKYVKQLQLLSQQKASDLLDKISVVSEFTGKNTKVTRERMKLELRFISDPTDVKIKDKYLEAWYNELKVEGNLLELYNPDDLEIWSGIKLSKYDLARSAILALLVITPVSFFVINPYEAAFMKCISFLIAGALCLWMLYGNSLKLQQEALLRLQKSK